MKTLLFIDDETKFLEVFEKSFSKKGYRVLTATSGEKGLASLYKFGRLVFPEIPFHGVATTFLDLENEMHRAFLTVPTEERDKIRRGLAGLTLEFKLAIKEGSSELVNEGLLIQETLKGLYEWAELGPEEWASEAREELDLIGRTLKEEGP